MGINAIDDERIGETSTPPTTLITIVCYDQPIYDNLGLEMDEWLGLTLGVDRASVLTTVRPMYDQAAIFIENIDSRLHNTFFATLEYQVYAQYFVSNVCVYEIII